jgi:hypothetical protein
MEYKAIAQRTAMVGGGTSYSVYVDKKQKNFHPLYGSRYATTHSGSSLDGEYYKMRDFLMKKTDMELCKNRPNEAWDAIIKERSQQADSLELEILKKAFPEANNWTKVPSLWIQDTHPSEHKTITFEAETN